MVVLEIPCLNKKTSDKSRADRKLQVKNTQTIENDEALEFGEVEGNLDHNAGLFTRGKRGA